MKGIIFKHFESFVVDNFGEATFEDLLDATELATEGPFVGPMTYPDEDLFALVGTAIAKLGISLNDALHAFGVYLFGKLAAQVPMFVDREAGLKSFLLTIHSVIHVEVRKLFPDAETPRFDYVDVSPSSLVIHYMSSRRLCPLFRGLIDGAAAHFEERVEYIETGCMHHGAARCTFEIQFKGSVRQAA
ncbi:Heme NO binding protein [Planctomycetes bacterium Poly30]|uniref:Heme NO binding protein n=1 Tax=Saltatorellus ferox TaxID=2528018 RepID=A0A518EZH0_9BACT|nr:Heme NO binding protein [Planctomycetes bacterium Poly30]